MPAKATRRSIAWTESLANAWMSVFVFTARKLATVADVHHIAVLDDIVLALQPQRPFGAGIGFRAGFEQLIPADRLSSDEVFFEVGVNCACGLLRTAVGRDLPGAAFVFPGGEK